jgi:hypothetical protein
MFHAQGVGSLHFAFASLSLLNLACSVSHKEHSLNIAAAGSSVTPHCFALTMEHLFSPRTSHPDLLEEDQGGLESVQQLNLDVSTEELLSAERAFTYADLYASLGNGDAVVWLTPHANVMRTGGKAVFCSSTTLLAHRFLFSVDGKEIFATARSSAARSEIFAVVGRLLAVDAIDVYELELRHYHQVFLNTPTFTYLMEQCQSLKVLSVCSLEMDEDQIRGLGALSSTRPGLEIKLIGCRISGASAEALAEVLQRNQGPTELASCRIDNSVLAGGLRGNSRLKLLSACLSSNNEGGGKQNREVLAIANALRENKGLVYLGIIPSFTMSDEAWGALCDSLKTLTHPTLQVLNLKFIQAYDVAPAVLNSRIPVFIQALVNMLKVNMSIHTIPLHPRAGHSELFQGSVVPYLETNTFRPHLLAIQKINPFPYRVKVLGRALLAARTDPNRFWMLLSGNAEIAFPSTTANLPSPAIDAGTSNAGVLPVAVAVTGASAAANFTTPTACLKRKARP